MRTLTDKKGFAGRQVGLSLVELMIAITIGLIMLVSLSTLFLNQSRSRSELDKSNRMIDNGRYAMELLSGNLRMAGFYGTYVPSRGAPTLASLDPCDTAALTDTTRNVDVMRLHVQGVSTATSASPSLAAWPLCAALITASGSTLKAGSDILVIRRANTATVTSAAAGDDTFYLQASSCPTDTLTYVIAANNPSAFKLLTKNCATAATPAPLRAFQVQVYFVSTNNNAGDGIPTLKRIELDPSGATSNFVVTPLVEGIEYMQFDFGVDNSPAPPASDGVVDTIVDCSACSLADWSNVITVKINLLARNQQTSNGWNENKVYGLGLSGTVGPFNDAYKRHAYTELVRLDNPAGRREAPCTAPCR